MGWKRGGSPDVIDLTMLQKRGLLKVPKESNNDYVDFSKIQADSSSSVGSISNSNPFGFLDSIAQASSSSSLTSSNSINSFSNTNSSDEVNTLRIKLEDTEYKLERALERIEKLEARFSEQ